MIDSVDCYERLGVDAHEPTRQLGVVPLNELLAEAVPVSVGFNSSYRVVGLLLDTCFCR